MFIQRALKVKHQKKIDDKQKHAGKRYDEDKAVFYALKRDKINQGKRHKIGAKEHSFAVKKRIPPIAVKKFGDIVKLRECDIKGI